MLGKLPLTWGLCQGLWFFFEVFCGCMFLPSYLSNNYLQEQGNETGSCITKCQRQRQGVGRKSELSTHLTEVGATDRNIRICVCCFSCCVLQLTAVASKQMLFWRWFFKKHLWDWLCPLKGMGRWAALLEAVLAYQLLRRTELTILNSRENPNLNLWEYQAVLPQTCVFRDVLLCTILRDCTLPVFRIVFFLTLYILFLVFSILPVCWL